MKRPSPLVSTCLTCCWTLVAAGAVALANPLPAFADNNTDLVTAAAHGDTSHIVALLGKGADVNVRDSGGYTPLIWAALNGHDQAVGELLRRGADVHARDKEGYTALMWAAQNHRADAVRALLAHGANPNETDREGYTALTWSAQDGQPGIASDLLVNGADPNVRDHQGYTPLMWAAQQGHNSVVKLLLANGGNPNVRDYKGFSALDLAIAFNRYDVKEYLMHAAPHSMGSFAGTRVAYSAPYVRGRNRGSVVAVVGTPGNWGDGYVDPGYTQGGYYVNGQWVANNGWNNSVAYAHPGWVPPGWSSVEARILSFDVDGNHVVDGRDWRNLTPARRTELANIVHGVRCNAAYCTPGHAASIRNKLDWVYADNSRLGLTLNMAYDFPMPNGNKPTW